MVFRVLESLEGSWTFQPLEEDESVLDTPRMPCEDHDRSISPKQNTRDGKGNKGDVHCWDDVRDVQEEGQEGKRKMMKWRWEVVVTFILFCFASWSGDDINATWT